MMQNHGMTDQSKPISQRLYAALVESPTLNFEAKQQQGTKLNLDVALFDCAYDFCANTPKGQFIADQSQLVFALLKLLEERGIDNWHYLPTRRALKIFAKVYCEELWVDRWLTEPSPQAVTSMRSSFVRAYKAA